MLLELTPEEVDCVVPIVPTRVQYSEYWSDALQNLGRFINAVLVGVALLVVSRLFQDSTFFSVLLFLPGILSLFYPLLWGPLWVISRRNLAFREIPYAALFFGQIRRTRRVTVIVEERETVDENGDLYVEEIRERQFEMEIGDDSGLTYRVRAKDRAEYDAIVKRQSVLALIKAYSRDLQQRPVISEVYVIKLGQWVGELSYLDRESFLDLANQILDEL